MRRAVKETEHIEGNGHCPITQGSDVGSQIEDMRLVRLTNLNCNLSDGKEVMDEEEEGRRVSIIYDDRWVRSLDPP